MNGILTHCHIICDPYLGIGIYVLNIILCSYLYFRNSMDLPWDPYLVPRDKSRYYSVKKCKYYPILGKHNDWVITDFIEKDTDEEEYESVQKMF